MNIILHNLYKTFVSDTLNLSCLVYSKVFTFKVKYVIQIRENFERTQRDNVINTLFDNNTVCKQIYY